MKTAALLRAVIGCLALVPAPPVNAADVTLTGTVLDSCTLNLSSAGLLVLSPDYTQLSSEAVGGAPATLTVASTGAFPTLTFGAPTLSSFPAGWTDTSTKEIRYTALVAPALAYTSNQTSRTLTTNADTFTLHGRVTNSGGFATGTYILRTVVTCSH